MKVLVTGAGGFIGNNLRVAPGARGGFEDLAITRASGDAELVVTLWANEIFDRQRPDTVASRVA